MEVQILKRDLKRYMSTTDLEKQNLEAHVDLCSERYKGLHDRLSAIEVRLQKMNEDQQLSHKSSQKTIIATAGTVVAGLLSTVVVILMKMPGENYQYMFIQIAPKARVYVTDTDVEFIREHALESFRSDQLSPEDADRAKKLADKAVFVRKKLDTHMQYALNRKIKFVANDRKK